VVAGVVPEGSEGGIHVQAQAFSEFAFGLFDDDPAVEGGLQLLADDFGAAQGASWEKPAAPPAQESGPAACIGPRQPQPGARLPPSARTPAMIDNQADGHALLR
jgi:hypothetical protein